MPETPNPRIPAGVEIPVGRPVEVKTGPGGASMRPDFVEVEVEDRAPHPVTGEEVAAMRKVRAIPQSTVDATDEMIAHVIALIEAEGNDAPAEEQIRARILHVARHIPPFSAQEVAVVVKAVWPWWGVTTRGKRHA